jgi:hypothetical protein
LNNGGISPDLLRCVDAVKNGEVIPLLQGFC